MANVLNVVPVSSKKPLYVKTVEQDLLCVAAVVNPPVVVQNAEQDFHIGILSINFFPFFSSLLFIKQKIVDQAGLGPAASTMRLHVATPHYNYVAIFQLIYWPSSHNSIPNILLDFHLLSLTDFLILQLDFL